MTQFSYNRKYELIVNSPVKLGDPQKEYSDAPLDNDSTTFSNLEDYTIIYNKALTFTDLQMEADIKASSKTAGSKGQQATIKIFNLSPESRAFVERTNNSVILNAGYETDGDTLPIIFTGQVSKCFSEKNGEDVITTLVCSEAATPKNSVRISLSVEEGFSYKYLFNRVIDEWRKTGLARGEIILDQSPVQAPPATSNPTTTILEKTFTFSGFLRQLTDELCEQFNLTYQVINGSLHIHPKRYSNFVSVVNIDYDNIVSIRGRQEAESSTSNNSDTKGVKIKVLLDGRINTAKKLSITGEEEGDYWISNVEHNLSYEGSNWYTTIECSSLET